MSAPSGKERESSQLAALLDGDDPALFPKLTEQQLDLLRPLGYVREVEAGEVLFSDGDAGYDPMVVLTGRVSVLAGGDEARELVGQRAGDLMVELNLFTGQPVGATGVVREAGRLLVVPAADFRALVGRELVFGDFVLQLLFRRRQALERLLLGIRIIGSRFDRETHRLREFAARNRVAHEWIDSDEPRAASLLAQLGLAAASGPVVLLGGTRTLQNPTNAELAEALGLHETPAATETTFDLVIVGAGPAGLAAAVYGASGGFSTAVLDSVAVGGQAATSARIENYLGFPSGISGAELAERGRIQADKFGAHFLIPRRAVGLADRDGYHMIELDDGGELLARVVILGLGVQYRRLSIPGLAEYEGLGVSYATDSAREQLRPGGDAVVVGGANSAGQAALALAEDGRHVYLVAREESLAQTETTISSRSKSGRMHPANAERSSQERSSSSSARHHTPPGSRTRLSSTWTASSSPAQRYAIKSRGGNSTATPSSSKRASPVSSPSATSAQAEHAWQPRRRRRRNGRPPRC